MFLIVGLGNPGLKYKKTRHNAGFIILEKLANQKLKKDKKFFSKISKENIENSEVILAQPQTFMNESGRAVQALASFYKVKPENIIIIHDDIDLPLGKIRIKQSGSAGSHNGIKSIIEHLGTQDFIKVKIGIGPQPDDINPRIDSGEYVLQKFKKDEWEVFQNEIIPQATEAIKTILIDGLEKAMNEYN